MSSLSRRQALLTLPMLATHALAQPIQSSAKRVGLLVAGTHADMQALSQEIESRLSQRGWQPGTVVIDGVAAENNLDRLPVLANELVKWADVIVTGGALTTLVAARATQKTPIVFLSVHYPLEHGLAESYSRPGRNVTGAALYHGLELTTKPLEFLREVAPAARRLAFVCPRDLMDLETVSGPRNDIRPVIERAARALGFEMRIYDTPAPDQLDAMFAAIVAGRAEALYGAIRGAPQPMTEFALRQRLPSLYPMRYFVEAGGLMSYGPLEADTRRATEHAARYIDRILRGASAAELAIDQPSRFELAINTRTARSIGAVLPRGLMLRADAVIG